ncbi:exodeoxyribonuclease VII large subunit, partial [bacterium LRH843]|nr:exodeoxyribonuclease VII large subunit [bacterium LRH843]
MNQAELSTEQSGEIYSVSSLNHEAALLLERAFACVWVKAEISNLTKHRSGHWYFDIKNE